MTIRNTRTGGQILIDQLVAQGVERVTCVPGESYLAALDALHDSPIDVMICRAEGGAAMMISYTGNTSGSRRKSVTSDTLAAPMAFWQCHYPSNIPRSAAQTTRGNRRYQSSICAA